MVMGKHRNAHSLLAEAQRRVSQLRVKVAEDIVNAHADIQRFDEQIKTLKASILKVNRWLDPKLGLAASITKWTDRSATAKENLKTAEKQKAAVLSQISSLKSDRATLALELAKDAEIEAETLVGDLQV